MTWWCSAQGTPWEWIWRAYPGVWIFVGVLAGGYAAALLRFGGRAHLRELISFGAGVSLLWAVADWPIGPLGAGYLLSVHMVQYLVFAMVAPPLLLHGVPRGVLRVLLRPRWASAVARAATRPVPAFAVFNVTLLATHLPPVVDGLRRSQMGSFALDMAWLISGLVFWWPVVAPLSELRPMGYPARILYLILNVFIPTVPASFFTFADFPIYAVYELAPRVAGITATADQQLAGLIMKVAGGLIIFGTATVLFFRWHLREEGEAVPSLAIPPTNGPP